MGIWGLNFQWMKVLFLLGMSTALTNHVLADTAAGPYPSIIQNSKFLFNPAEESNYASRLFQKQASKKTNLIWKLGLDGQGLQTDRNNNSQVASLQTRLKLRSNLTRQLSIFGDARVRFRSGRTQRLFGDQESGTNIYLRQGELNFQGWKKRITIGAGVLSQKSMVNNPFLVGSLGFPGVHQRIKIKGKTWGVALAAQQVIPTSSTLSTRVQGREQVPSLFTEKLTLDWHPRKGTWIAGRLGWFSFYNLPSIVAHQSQLFGNTFTGQNDNNAFFLFGFNGWSNQFIVDQAITSRLAVQVKGIFLRNIAAEDTLNESRILSGVLAYEGKKWLYFLGGESFFSEPDSSPSYYNSWRRGHNNRIGWGMSAFIESKVHNFRFGFEFFDAKLLNVNQFSESIQQDNQQTFLVKLETAYDLF